MKILNIRNLNRGGLDALLAFCEDRVKKGTGAFLVPINPIKVVKARSRPDFQEIIDGADWVFPDARGMQLAAAFLYGTPIPVVPGYKVFFALIEQARSLGAAVFLLGATENNLRKAVTGLEAAYPGIRIAGSHNGFFSVEEEREIGEQVAALNPKYVFVAMGEYKQEKIIASLRRRHPGAVYLGVGGTLDLISGSQPAPPDWVRRHRLEWLYRLYRQPFRLPRFKALPMFVFFSVIEKVKLMIGSDQEN